MRAVALKEQGTHPPAEGILARFAEVRAIGSLSDLERVRKEHPDIVLMDLGMPRMGGKEAVEVLRGARPRPMLVLFDSKAQPAVLLRRLNSLSGLRLVRPRRPPGLGRVLRLLGVSQEGLARMLGVSSRTAHRWLKGTRPRRIVEMDKLMEVVVLLEQSLTDDEAIRRYLHHANPNLQGEKPIDLLMRKDFDRVSADLQAVQEGVYV